MAKYRKIDSKLWADRKFIELSPPQPCGRYLWLYLLTGPHTTSIPGLFAAGEASLAESLEWPLEAFRKAFREAFVEGVGKGMVEADWKARVVWVPNAIRYNEPESPNVVRSWRSHFDDIPECPLRDKALRAIRTFCETRGEGFAKAFREAFGEAMPESGTGTGTGTERVRDADASPAPIVDAKPDGQSVAKKPRTPRASPADSASEASRDRRMGSGLPPPAAPSPHRRVVAAFCDGWAERYGERYPFADAKDGAIVKRIVSACMDDGDRAADAVRRYLADNDEFFVKDRHGLGLLLSQIRRFIVPAKRAVVAAGEGSFSRVDQ